MADFYGFPIHTKSNAGPKIKWVGAYFDNESNAMGFATQFDACAANNAKAGVNARLVAVSEQAYEIPENQMSLRDECSLAIRLYHQDENGQTVCQGYMTVPCLQYSLATSFMNSLPNSGLMIAGPGAEGSSEPTYYPVNAVEVASIKTYAL